MIKNFSGLEIKIGERAYQLVCALDSPIGELHDALCHMKNFVIHKVNEINSKESQATTPLTPEPEAPTPEA
jgi:hypothetical protein